MPSAFVPYTGVTPDLSPLANGAAPYFAKALLVAKQPKFWRGSPPGHGGEFSAVTFMRNSPTGGGQE